MTQVAEAYFHLKRVELTPLKLQELGDLTAVLAAEAARSLFPPESVIDIRLSEGSLKGWATVTAASMLGVYGFVADYKGFKEGIGEITSDAKRFGEAVIEGFTSKSDLKGAYVYRKERRTKTPGRIKRLIEKQEWLEEHKSQLPKHVVEDERLEIERLLQVILSDLEPAEQITLRGILQGSEKPPPVPDKARVGLSSISDRHQLTMLQTDADSHPDHIPDYLRRFRLADGPRLIAPAHGQAARLTGRLP